jgi:hypothetical protein
VKSALDDQILPGLPNFKFIQIERCKRVIDQAMMRKNPTAQVNRPDILDHRLHESQAFVSCVICGIFSLECADDDLPNRIMEAVNFMVWTNGNQRHLLFNPLVNRVITGWMLFRLLVASALLISATTSGRFCQ